MIEFEYFESSNERTFIEELETATENIIEAHGADSIISVSHSLTSHGFTKFSVLITFKTKP